MSTQKIDGTESRHRCCVPLCSRSKIFCPSLSFHCFPKDGESKRRWLANIRLDRFSLNDNSRVCSQHFQREDISEPTRPDGRRRLKSGAVPVLFQWNNFTAPACWQKTERSDEDERTDDSMIEDPTMDHDYCVIAGPVKLEANLREMQVGGEKMEQHELEVETEESSFFLPASTEATHSPWQLSVVKQESVLPSDGASVQVGGEKTAQHELEVETKEALSFLLASTEAAHNPRPLSIVENTIKQETVLPSDGASERIKQESNDLEVGGAETKGSLGTQADQNKKRKLCDSSSLTHLAQKFLEMVSLNPDRTVDLNDVANELGIRKRRIYDITNVLEGIKVIHKKSKSMFQWSGATVDPRLNAEVTALLEEELRLDKLIYIMTIHIRRLFEDLYCQRYAYVTHDDIRKIPSLKDQVVIVIKAPMETKVEVPHPKQSLQVYLKSTEGPIDAFVCSDDSAPAEASDRKYSAQSQPSSSSSFHQTSFREKSIGSCGESSFPSTQAKPTPHSSPVTVTSILTSPQIHSKDQNNSVSVALPVGLPPSGEGIVQSGVQHKGVTDRFAASVDFDTLPQKTHFS